MGLEVGSIRRFPMGLAHYVYDVQTEDGRSLVVRLARSDLGAAFASAIHWHSLLRPRGVPLPELHYAEVDEQRHGFPVMILERLRGTDLGDVYQALTAADKRALAGAIVRIQHVVHALPLGSGYGYGRAPDDPMLRPSWNAVLVEHLERSRKRIRAASLVDERWVDRVQEAIDRASAVLAGVSPTCFLDDTTTKNVIVHDGELTGIVDVDEVCYGDPLRTPALTQAALVALGYDTDYVDAWLDSIRASTEDRRAVQIYTAMYCVDLLSELGMRFNKHEDAPVDRGRMERLSRLLDSLIGGP